ncbi:MAG TPA: glycosyltransferase family 4 protein [Ruminiclostridium sp.]
MKICFYCNTIFSYGGVQRVLAVIAKALSKNHNVTILTLDDPSLEDKTMYGLDSADLHYAYLKYPKLPTYEMLPCKTFSLLYKKLLPQNKLFSRWYGYSSFPQTHRSILINQIKTGDYDVIVGVHVFLSFHLASIHKSIRANTIGWMHNSYDAYFTMENSYLGNLKNLFVHQMPLLDRIIVLSNYDKRLYLKELNIKSEVIYNPLTIIPGEVSSLFNKKFLAIGRFSHLHKGFDILIKAFAIFAQTNYDWTLDIVGEGPEEPLLRSIIHQHQLENRVTLHPFTNDVQKYYSAASIYVLSSRWEGFGLVLFEAMSSGLPIISSDIPVAKELLEGEGVAVFFKSEDMNDLAQKMREMINNNKLKQMSDAALQYASINGIEKIILQWETLLKDI